MFESMFGNKRMYLDYASATPVALEALCAVHEAEQIVGNPGSIHAEGAASKAILEQARVKIAHHLGCKARDIVFTSGGTEANNLAVLGFARAIEVGAAPRLNLGSVRGLTSGPLAGTHWIVSAIEHPSVLECFSEIERLGGDVSFADPDESGVIRPETVERFLRRETVFVSIGWANGEIGTVQPIAKIVRVLRAHQEKHKTNVIFHSDAGQTFLYEAAHVHSLGVDILTLDSGKLYGPRGVGALYLSERVSLKPIQLGGKQERGLRAGTENVALASGFAAAFDLVAQERESESKRLQKLRDDFAKEIIEKVPGAVVNGDLKRGLPNLLNVSIPNINSEYLVLALDRGGIAVSTKSACREGEEQRSHVVEAMTDEIWRSRNTLRFSLGRGTTQHELGRVVAAVAEFVKSPAAKA